MRRQAAGRVREQAPASALNRLFSTVTTTQTGPPRPDPPQGEATPEIGPDDLDEIGPDDLDEISYRTVVGGGEGRIIVIANRQERFNKL